MRLTGRVTTIGIVSPGAMGSALGRAWAAGGTRVVATVAGRSERTRALATGLELLPDLSAVVTSADVVVSVCPPAEAGRVLEEVLAVVGGARPLLADLNAVAPATVTRLGTRAADAGLGLVDGAISGPPPADGGSTTLYLSGARAAELDLPAPGLTTRIVGDRVGTASAVKMCTASVYKGTAALWTQALRTAAAYGVTAPVLDDLGGSAPDAARRIASAVSKSGRFVDEMEQIAATQAAAGATPDLFGAMAAVYRELAATPLAALTPEDAAQADDLADVLRRLAGS